MNQTKPDIDAEFFALMSTLERSEPIKCAGGSHEQPWEHTKSCSVVAIARVSACGMDNAPACAVKVQYYAECISEEDAICARCSETLRDHWRIDPL